MSGSGSANIWMNRNRPQLTAEQQPLTMNVQQQSIPNALAAQFNAPAPSEQQQAEEPSQNDEEDLMKLLRKYWSAIV